MGFGIAALIPPPFYSILTSLLLLPPCKNKTTLTINGNILHSIHWVGFNISNRVLLIIQLSHYLVFNRIHTRNVAADKKMSYTSQRSFLLYQCHPFSNESENSRRFLPLLSSNKITPLFEVIVINDGSKQTKVKRGTVGFLKRNTWHLYHSFTPERARYISCKNSYWHWASKPANTTGWYSQKPIVSLQVISAD